MKSLPSAILYRWLAPTLVGLATVLSAQAETPKAERMLQG